jgi:hypothetical protein
MNNLLHNQDALRQTISDVMLFTFSEKSILFPVIYLVKNNGNAAATNQLNYFPFFFNH